MQNRYIAVNIRKYLNENDCSYSDEQDLDDFIMGYLCPKNPEVEAFFAQKNKARNNSPIMQYMSFTC